VIKQIRDMNQYDDINILVHTNMANEIMKKELFLLGANEIVSKVDIPTLSSAIQKFIR
jgi:CheY-like chemotaxis protein